MTVVIQHVSAPHDTLCQEIWSVRGHLHRLSHSPFRIPTLALSPALGLRGSCGAFTNWSTDPLRASLPQVAPSLPLLETCFSQMGWRGSESVCDFLDEVLEKTWWGPRPLTDHSLGVGAARWPKEHLFGESPLARKGGPQSTVVRDWVFSQQPLD